MAASVVDASTTDVTAATGTFRSSRMIPRRRGFRRLYGQHGPRYRFDHVSRRGEILADFPSCAVFVMFRLSFASDRLMMNLGSAANTSKTSVYEGSVPR